MQRENGKHKRTVALVQLSLLVAIEALFCFTPLGSLPALGPIVATLAAVPVVATAILLGTGAGAFLGFCAGLFSLIVWTFMPPSPLGFVFSPFVSLGDVHGNFWSLVICFVPRILIGVVAGLSFQGLRRAFPSGEKKRNDWISYGLSGALGSLANTFFVLGGIYVFFGASYAQALGVGYELLLGMIALTVLTSGIPEAIVNAVVATFVCRPLRNAMERR